MDDAMRGRLLAAARRLVRSDEAYAAARKVLDEAVAEDNAARDEIADAMGDADVRLVCVGDVLFERETGRVVHWRRLDVVLPDDRGGEG